MSHKATPILPWASHQADSSLVQKDPVQGWFDKSLSAAVDPGKSASAMACDGQSNFLLSR